MHDTRRVRLVLGILLIAAVALITIDFRDGGTSPARGVGSSVFGPVERVASDVTSPVSSVFDWVTGGPSADSKIASLQAANAKLRADLSAAQLSKADESQLSSLLKLAGRGGYRIVAASVIAAGQDYTDTVTLDVGRKDGVRAHETVLNGQGLVGTVTQVSADTSTVLLANDASAVVGARLAGSNQIGSVAGTGKSLSGPTTLKLTLFAANAVLQSGQDLVTFGSVHDTPYVPGVPIGQVTKVQGNAGSLTKTALVKPYVDFTSLGVVGVVVGGPAKDPRDSVLPSGPKPVPTVTVTVTPSAGNGTGTGTGTGATGTGAGTGTGG
jgi:rod shape-determining protein MreC